MIRLLKKTSHFNYVLVGNPTKLTKHRQAAQIEYEMINCKPGLLFVSKNDKLHDKPLSVNYV